MRITISKGSMMRLLVVFLLLLTTGFAVQVVTFDNSWGQNPLWNVISETPSGVELVFSLHEMLVDEVTIEGMPMQSYGFASIYIPQAGAPSLGGATRYIAIPQGAIAQVTIVDARTEVYQGVEILPAPNIPFESDDSPLRYEKDMAIYSRNAYFPAPPVLVSEPMQIRGVDVVIVNVTPFQYNPVRKELVVYKDLRFWVDFVGGNGRFGDNRLRNRFWEPILQGHLLNYGSLPQIDFYAPERINARDGWEYIIIVPDDPVFEAWADTIKHWRKLQGISCEVFTLTEVGGSSVSAIENFLNNAYTTWNPAPVAFLLLSDYPSSGDVYGITSPTYIYSYTCVTDNKYADVDGDSLPDMHHARICAQTEAHLGTMINKFLGYERNPYTAPNFYNEPLMACGWQTERWFQLTVEIIRGYFINVQGKNPARQYNIYLGTPTVGGPWSSNANTYMIVAYFGSAGLGYIPDTNPYDAAWWNSGSSVGVTNAINSGAFLLQHRDHGVETGWGKPYYRNEHLDDLTNTMFTFVYSTNCLTGTYDWSDECFTEKFHRIDYGALGLNAASGVSYSFVNDTYLWGMYDCLWPDFMPDYPLMGPQIPMGHPNLMPCMAMSSGKYFLAQSSWPNNPINKDETYHLFHHHGDAFNVLYSEVPQNLSVAHAPILQHGSNTFAVSANDSAVIALTVNGEIIGVAEGTGTPVNIIIPPQVPGTIMKVTITKSNYYRYESDVNVVAITSPYVMFAAGIIDDQSGGNNDGIVNPGETIDYGVWAKNVGVGTAQNVYGFLATSNPYLTMNVDSSWYGNINENDSALSSPYYEYTIANNCPDGHVISFDLEFHSGDSIFTSHPSITVYAPVLTYQGYIVVDGNGILDPGETVDLVVTLKNEGGAVAENVTSILITASSYITIHDNAGNFGTIAPGATASNADDPYIVTADVATPYGTSVDVAVAVQSGVYMDTLDFSLIVGQQPPSDTGCYYVYYSDGPHTYSPVFDWVGIDSTQGVHPGISTNLGGNQTIQVNLPFSFQYYGVSYNQISICSNGWIAMGHTTSTDHTNSGIPNGDGPPAMIAGLWDDLEPGNAGQPSDVYYYYDAANHRFIVEYFKVEHWPSGYHETFEIILYDPVYYPTPTGDGEIVVLYLVGLQQTDVTLGIENAAQNVGIQYYFDGSYHPLAVTVTDSFALRYTTYPPDYVGALPVFSVTPASIDFGEVAVGSSKTDSVTVTNTGSAALEIASVESDNAEFTVTPTTGSLAAGASMQFYITFAPTDPGAETGNILFTHNATSSPDTVTVAGNGVVGIKETADDVIPAVYALSQNYPNPFKTETGIRYQLPRPNVVTIAIYNVSGQCIKTMVNEHRDAGYYKVYWDGKGEDSQRVGNGVYFCRMKAGEYTAVKKILLMR